MPGCFKGFGVLLHGLLFDKFLINGDPSALIQYLLHLGRILLFMFDPLEYVNIIFFHVQTLSLLSVYA